MPVALGDADEAQAFVDPVGGTHRALGRQDDARAAADGPGPVDAGAHEGLADSKYRPCPLLVKYVEAGWLGRKTQRGFYDYRGDKPVPTR